MSNNYAQFSEEMVVPAEKVDAIQDFIAQYVKDCDAGKFDFFGGVELEWDVQQATDSAVLWFHSDDNFMDEELTYLVQGVLRVIDDPNDRPFFVNVAYTASRPLLGEFSGGCYVFWKDADYYVDPYTVAVDYVKFHDGRPE